MLHKKEDLRRAGDVTMVTDEAFYVSVLQLSFSQVEIDSFLNLNKIKTQMVNLSTKMSRWGTMMEGKEMGNEESRRRRGWRLFLSQTPNSGVKTHFFSLDFINILISCKFKIPRPIKEFPPAKQACMFYVKIAITTNY